MIIERVLWCLMLGFIFDLKKRQIASEKSCQVFSKNIFYMSHVMLNRYVFYKVVFLFLILTCHKFHLIFVQWALIHLMK